MKTLFLLLALGLPLLAQDESKKRLDSPTKVDDGDKGSSRISDMVTTAETAKKALDAYNVAATGANAIKNPEKFKEKFTGVLSTDKLKSVLKKNLVEYKSTKAGFVKLTNDVLTKTSDILMAANKRVNMWRTTEPMLKYYGKRMLRVSDNTVEVAMDFKPKDVVDIDRKWSRGVENALLQDKATLLSFNSFLNTRFRDTRNNEMFFAGLFFSNDVVERLTRNEASLKALLEMPISNEFHAIPFKTLGFTTEAINGVRTISSQAHGPAQEDGSVSQETYNFDQIRNALEDGNQTYEDTKQLAVLIARRRSEVAVQTAQTEQILSLLQTKYSRLLLRKVESNGADFEDYNTTLNKILNGGSFQDIDSHRRQIFKEASLGS